MNHTRRTLFSLIALLALASTVRAGEPIRVACVGDSITYGEAVPAREKNCYPAVLGGLLGPSYEVRNFGVSGSTLLARGDAPYRKTEAFKLATEFKPDIVVIKLGTNDTKPQNWKHKDEFASDYTALIKHFAELESKPAVYLVLPVPIFAERVGSARENLLEQQMLIKKIAADAKLPLIDAFATVNKPELFDRDGVHPNAAGAQALAQLVARALEPDPPKPPPAPVK